MPRIAVLDYRLTPDVREQIQALASNRVVFPKSRCPEDELIAQTGDAEIVLASPWDKLSASYFDACPAIKYIGLCGTSTANIALDELKKRHITFSNIVSHHKEPVAEFFFMQLMSLLRGAGKYQWRAEEHELKGKRLGIIGLGAVGQAVAHLALAYKTDATYYSPHRKQDWEDRGLKYLDISELTKSNEILIICSPTNVEVLGKAEFDAMPPGSILLQASAGSPFDKTAFYDWIAREDNYALFDMSAGVQNHQAYKALPRVIFSEAVAGDTYESNQRRALRAVENLKQHLQSQTTR